MTENNRLTDEELAEIRKRAQRALDLNPFDSLKYFEVSGTIYNEDIPKLLAEIDQLQNNLEEAVSIIETASGAINDVDYEEESRIVNEYLYGGDA